MTGAESTRNKFQIKPANEVLQWKDTSALLEHQVHNVSDILVGVWDSAPVENSDRLKQIMTAKNENSSDTRGVKRKLDVHVVCQSCGVVGKFNVGVVGNNNSVTFRI